MNHINVRTSFLHGNLIKGATFKRYHYSLTVIVSVSLAFDSQERNELVADYLNIHLLILKAPFMKRYK